MKPYAATVLYLSFDARRLRNNAAHYRQCGGQLAAQEAAECERMADEFDSVCAMLQPASPNATAKEVSTP